MHNVVDTIMGEFRLERSFRYMDVINSDFTNKVYCPCCSKGIFDNLAGIIENQCPKCSTRLKVICLNLRLIALDTLLLQDVLKQILLGYATIDMKMNNFIFMVVTIPVFLMKIKNLYLS